MADQTRIEWVNSLKVGDEVYFNGGMWGRIELAKVTKVTPQQVVISSGTRLWKKNGTIVGENWRTQVKPLTDELREQAYKAESQTKINRLNISSWPLERLKRLMAIIDEPAATNPQAGEEVKGR